MKIISDLLNCIDKDKFPVSPKVPKKINIENNNSKYLLDNLQMFNKVLNAFNDKYSYSIKKR